jgi:transcription elongation factor GreA
VIRQKGNSPFGVVFFRLKALMNPGMGDALLGRTDHRLEGRRKKMATSFLTREGFEKLQDELDTLRTQRRQEIAERLHEAMEGGELIENAEYEAAKNEQAFVEGRIKELEVLLATARVVEEGPLADTVQVGTTVIIKEEGSRDEETYSIVGAAEANPSEGKISNESPLGKALINKKTGDKVQVDAPQGTFVVSIVKVE